MSLKQIKPMDRIIFLKRFTAELMINSEEQKPSKQIEVEKLKQKFLQPIDSPEKAFRKAINTGFFPGPIYSREIRKIKPIKIGLRLQETISALGERKPLLHRAKIMPKQMPIQQIRKPILGKKHEQPAISPQAQALKTIKPEAQPRPGEFTLGRLEQLLKDSSIQAIECPGPGRNLLVKRYNKINVTRLTLGQSEITKIINNFSEKARIPITGGILKAAVGDLVISAVISEFVGSRFIINKITPYSLIEQR